jgi:hypothetical protein
MMLIYVLLVSVTGMAGRTFAGSTVRARFFPLQQYMSGDFSDKPAATAATSSTAASTTTAASSSSTPGFVILNADADGPQLPTTVAAADDDMGEMPDFDAMDYSSYAYGATAVDASTAASTGNGSAAAGTAAAAGGAEEYDPFAAADEVD